MIRAVKEGDSPSLGFRSPVLKISFQLLERLYRDECPLADMIILSIFIEDSVGKGEESGA